MDNMFKHYPVVLQAPFYWEFSNQNIVTNICKQINLCCLIESCSVPSSWASNQLLTNSDYLVRYKIFIDLIANTSLNRLQYRKKYLELRKSMLLQWEQGPKGLWSLFQYYKEEKISQLGVHCKVKQGKYV